MSDREIPAVRRRRSAPVLLLVALLVVVGGSWAGRTLWPRTAGAPPTAVGGTGTGTGRSEPGRNASTGAPAGASADGGRAVGLAFLSAWQTGDYARMHSLVADRTDDLERAYGGMAGRLQLTAVRAVPRAYIPAGADGATLTFRATMTLASLGDISYDGAVHLVRTADGWRVRFTSDTVHPSLQRGQRLDLVTTAAPRAALTDREGRPLTADADLAVNLVGAVGADGVGVSGLQRLLDPYLRGRPGRVLAVVDATTGRLVTPLHGWPGTAAPPVRTTLDLSVQRAGEQALADVPGTAAVVAVDTASGEIRALANRPTSGVPAGLNGSFAPGSTFKVVTATAALLAGYTPASSLGCPASVTVGGRTIRNHEGQLPGDRTSLASAFATSCNTAFVNLSTSLSPTAVHDAAALYGFDAGAPLPIASQGGSAPVPSSVAEAAEGAIGQGGVQASPLQMASVAAAVASGTWHQPHVLACPDCASHRIPVAAGLRTMMRAAVTSGTGTRLAATPGGPVYGKTGTAEYGTAQPPATHAWFVGWQEDLAFAVFVHDGASGATAAAPVADRFLRALAAG